LSWTGRRVVGYSPALRAHRRLIVHSDSSTSGNFKVPRALESRKRQRHNHAKRLPYLLMASQRIKAIVADIEAELTEPTPRSKGGLGGGFRFHQGTRNAEPKSRDALVHATHVSLPQRASLHPRSLHAPVTIERVLQDRLLRRRLPTPKETSGTIPIQSQGQAWRKMQRVGGPQASVDHNRDNASTSGGYAEGERSAPREIDEVYEQIVSRGDAQGGVSILSMLQVAHLSGRTTLCLRCE
jgi:hypothetical protein